MSTNQSSKNTSKKPAANDEGQRAVKKGVWDDEEDYDSEEAEGEFGLDSNATAAGEASNAGASGAVEGGGQKASAASNPPSNK